MNEFLTQHYLSLKWDNSYLNTLNTSFSEDTIVSLLDSTFKDWTYEITCLAEISGSPRVAINLYLPGRFLSGTGLTEEAAICKIIKRIVGSSNTATQTVSEAPSETISSNDNSKKVTTEDIMGQLQNMKNELSNNNDTHQTQTQSQEQKTVNKQEDIFAGLIGLPDTSIPADKEIPQEVPFDSPEAEKLEKELAIYHTVNMNEVDDLQPTPMEVNPTNAILINQWTPELAAKLKAWSVPNGITNKEQMSCWTKKYCGLDYDHFNPQYVDKFIQWTEKMREKQVY